MKTSPLFVLAMLAGVLSACNNTTLSENQSDSTNATSAVEHNIPAAPENHQPASSHFVKVSNSPKTASAPTSQEIRALFRNDIVVKTKPINFIYPHASLVISKDPVEETVYSLHLVSKQAGQGFKRHFLRRVFPEGSAPEFPVIFTMNADQDSANELVVLCRWRILHQGMGIDANLYQPLVFDNVVDPMTQHIRVLETITNTLGEGYDGRMEQGNESYGYKDQASLQRKIQALRSR